MSTDYSKWENVEFDDDDDDIVDAVNQKRAQLERNKRFADEVFIRAESVNSDSSHQNALSTYELLLSEIEEAYALPPLAGTLDELFISCQLNAACCSIRLGQWDGAIAYCNAVLTPKYFNKLKSLHLIRISYFKCRAMLSKEQLSTSSITLRQLTKEVTVFKELLSNYCDSAEGMDVVNTADFRAQMQNYQEIFREIEEFSKSHGGFKKTVNAIELINSATRFLQSGKFDLAVIDFQPCLQISDLSTSQSFTVHNGLAQAYMATSKHKQGADSFLSSIAYMTASTPETLHKEQAAVCLKAAAIYFKLRLFEEASSAYLTCLQYLEDYITVHDAAASGGFSSSTDGNITMLHYIGKAGLAAAWIALRRNLKEAAENLVQAANYFEQRTFELCCNERDTSGISATAVGDLTQKLATVCPLIQHLCTSYDSLGNCCVLLASAAAPTVPISECDPDDEAAFTSTAAAAAVAQKHHDNCDFVCDRTIDCTNALLTLLDGHYYSGRSVSSSGAAGVPDAVSSVIRLLRTRRAYAYFAKAQLYTSHTLTHTNIVADATITPPSSSSSGSGTTTTSAAALGVKDLRKHFPFRLPPCKLTTKHTANSDHHSTLYESIPEALMTFYDYAGGEYVALDNLLQAIACYQNLGGLMMSEAKVEAFQLEHYNSNEGRVDDVVLERGHDVWRQVAALCDKHIALLKQRSSGGAAAASPAASIGYRDSDVYYYQQQSLLALYNAGLFATLYDLTQAQRALEAALSVRDAISKSQRHMTSSNKPHNYYITLGDISYHLGQVYLRVGRLEYAVSEARDALYCYHYRETPAEEQQQGLLEVPRPEEGLTREQREDVDRVRVRQAYGLLAVALSCKGQTELANEVLFTIRAGCIGPIEDGDAEVAAVRRQIEQRKSQKPAGSAAPTPTVASFMKPGSGDDAVNGDDDEDEQSADKKKTGAASESDEGGGPSNFRVERFEDDTDTAEDRGSEVWRKFLAVAKKSPTFVWFYRQLRPLVSLVMSMIYTRRGSGADVRNDSAADGNEGPQEVDFNLIASYSILGCFLGLILAIVVKVYEIY